MSNSSGTAAVLDQRLAAGCDRHLVIVVESTELLGASHTSGPLRSIFEALFGTFPRKIGRSSITTYASQATSSAMG